MQSGYILQIVNAKNELITERIFSIPNQLAYENGNLGNGKMSGGTESLDKVNFSITLPIDQTATKINLRNPSGDLMSSVTLSNNAKGQSSSKSNSVIAGAALSSNSCQGSYGSGYVKPCIPQGCVAPATIDCGPYTIGGGICASGCSLTCTCSASGGGGTPHPTVQPTATPHTTPLPSSSGISTPAPTPKASLGASPTPVPSAPPKGSNALNILVLGADFGGASIDSIASAIQQKITTTPPYSDYPGRVKVNSYSTTANLGCQQGGTRLLICDLSAVASAANSSGQPYDSIIVVDNTSTYSGAGYIGQDVAVLYNGSYTPSMSLHEFGHSFASLRDEYSYAASGGPAGISPAENCYAGSPPNPDWADVSGAQYVPSCTDDSWYRSSQSSVMLSYDDLHYNAVSIKYIKQRIDSILR